MTDPPGKVLLAVSDEMTQIYKEQFGRGPARARAYMAGDDLLVVATTATLAASGTSLHPPNPATTPSSVRPSAPRTCSSSRRPTQRPTTNRTRP